MTRRSEATTQLMTDALRTIEGCSAARLMVDDLRENYVVDANLIAAIDFICSNLADRAERVARATIDRIEADERLPERGISIPIVDTLS
jgi:hypothetical protein